MLKWKLWRSKWLALSYLTIISVLFFLPASALPENDWLTRINFDKFVHFCIFAGLLFIWRSSFDLAIKNYTAVLFMAALLYGFMVELIQKEWIPNRSFDPYDVIADALGSLAGLYVWARARSNR